MDKETREFIKLCDDPKIQEGWKPKVGDKVWRGKKYLPIEDACGVITDNNFCLSYRFGLEKTEKVWLPSLGQLLDILGERFYNLTRMGKNNYTCEVSERDSEVNNFFPGISRRIAAIKAVIEVRKEK